MLKSCLTLFATALLVMPVLAQGATPAMTSAPAAGAYDPKPFLDSLVKLRSTAETCDPYVSNEPAARTSAIVEFFVTLKQPLPALAVVKTQKSLDRFVRSQAGALCQDMLNSAYEAYTVEVDKYVKSKPEAWPAPPAISRAQWCADPNCLEL
jgi:hypothetical protein